MSDPVTTTISDALKSAVVTAAQAHLATETAAVQRVVAAVQADLPSVGATAVSIEALVKAEVAKLVADVSPSWKPWMTYASIAVVSVGGAVVAHLVHLF